MALARQALATFPVADNQAQREFDFSDADFQALSVTRLFKYMIRCPLACFFTKSGNICN